MNNLFKRNVTFVVIVFCQLFCLELFVESPRKAPDFTEEMEISRMIREKALADPNRPCWHFAVPENHGFPGDTNGAFFSNGRYHLKAWEISPSSPW